jgi:hypothetical protein
MASMALSGANMEENKLKAVSDYLQAEFPNSVVQYEHNSTHQAFNFSVQLEGATFQAEVEDEFLRNHNASAIVEKLRKFTLAEHLRDLPLDIVVVTNAGLKLQYE